MKLHDRTVSDFACLLASSEPAPGGGSTAALEGALGAALIGMVASLSTGRAKYAAHEPLMKEIIHEAEVIRNRLLDVMERDTEAFMGVTAALALPKDSSEEKAARAAAMQEALKACTLTPLELMRCCHSALQLAGRMSGKYNSSAASDLGVAALSLKAAIEGAWLNILINLGGIRDEAFTGKCRGEGQAILDDARPLADRVYTQALDNIWA
jgi:formiminotetrahydrofolate cyclodeaminase